MAKRIQQQNAKEKEKFHEWCAEFERSTGRTLPVGYEELRQLVLKGDYTREQRSDAFNLGAMFKSAFTVANELKNYGYGHVCA